VVIGRLGEDVRTKAKCDAAVELEHGPAPQHACVTFAFEDEPRLPEDGRVTPEHAPAAAQPQMAAEDEPTLEAEEQVLADGLDALEPASVEPRRELLHR